MRKFPKETLAKYIKPDFINLVFGYNIEGR